MDRATIGKTAIEDLLREFDSLRHDKVNNSAIEKIIKALDDIAHIGKHECGSELYCAAASISNRIVPGLEDRFFHICEEEGIVARFKESYPDSQYQDTPHQICPSCNTDYTKMLLEKGIDYDMLAEGTSHLPTAGSENCMDLHRIVFEGGYAICSRRWSYDDGDMNDDSGEVFAKVPKELVDRLLNDVKGSKEEVAVVDSINSWASSARYSEGQSEDLREVGYKGKAKLIFTYKDDELRFRLIPTAPAIPQYRLTEGRDYLLLEKEGEAAK
ncbi:MAG TPA: hypothetical protein VJI75_03750 [Candidatus Nanoarchaeia archaeon]|nr:hypothetical protein [Candidatus Nanoarchaeia archaeon]